MRAAGVTTMLALARADISPWLVFWWILCGLWLLISALWLVRHFQLQRRGVPQPQWPTPGVACIGAGCSLLVWGMSAGWATLP